MKQLVTFLLLTLALVSCYRKSIPNAAKKISGTETGLASFYAASYNGKKTANGEIFKSSAYTAAHKQLPFNTKVKVTNLTNGKTVKVRINDRGPFVAGRMIDLTRAAAKKIDMVGAGVVKVKIRY
ncbi:MAG: septal ring lytic transglycosylase RlpA family protein [Chitinophagaceae bacterium]|nr:septal ring lytic transglycosylase RlpA family protein [Chitinophagaceae bacterium]